MEKIQYFGLAVILIGLIFIWSPAPIRFITLIMDTTPPQWKIATDGGVAIFPRDGETYQVVDRIQAGVLDPESGVKSVTAVLDGISYTLTLYIGSEYDGQWWVKLPAPLPDGSHTMTLTATNYNGLSTTYTAKFTVYTALQGSWFINEIEITDPAQTIRLTTYTLTFKFAKTQGVPDNMIRCTVEWTGPETGSLTLTNTAPATWTGTYTYTKGGTYTITLKAYDGTTTITFTIFNMDVMTPPTLPPLSLPQQIGIALTTLGAALTIMPRLTRKP